MHLGRGITIPARNIIAIIDIKNTRLSDTRNYLQAQAEEGFVMACGEDKPYSMVIAEDAGQSRVYLSLAKPATLLRRAGTFSD